ncbi:MAG TPA: putative Fe-S cluster assembly protein SufT [Thermoanaerobaculia bacterium]|nr:putative Fe-S cluster assembly protein SufT [Thermoanaerobaculia bacterium]
MYERVTVSRDFDAVAIPSGEIVKIDSGTQATITQSLGGAYTIMTDRGMMVRVSGQEVEAIGKEPAKTIQVDGNLSDQELEKHVWEQLRTCYDPEIPVNIVDLGLVYLCEVAPEPEGGHKVTVKMTLTAPGCGMGPVLAADVRNKVLALPGVKDSDIQVVFDPVWDRSMMSEAAKLQLGMMW